MEKGLGTKWADAQAYEEYKLQKAQEEKEAQEEADKKVVFLIVVIISVALIVGVLYSYKMYTKMHETNIEETSQ